MHVMPRHRTPQAATATATSAASSVPRAFAAAFSAVVASAVAAVVACGQPPGDAAFGGSADMPSPETVRTADPFARGYAVDDFPRVQELAPGVYAYEQLRSAGDERFTTVSLFVTTDEGVLVADGQGSPEETRRLVETIAGITDQPVAHVVIGSDHGDHTAGNSEFPASARFYAHPTSRAALEATARAPGRSADAPPVVVPDEIVETSRTLTLGGTEVRILFLGRAHTGGDLVVHLPKERVLFMSETYLHRVFPAMRTAFPSEWIAMLEAAQAIDVDYYVPGHGFVDSPAVLKAELDVFRRAVQQVVDEATRLHAAGLPLEEAVAEADFGDLESWSLRSSQAPRAIGRVYMELNGELPPG